MAFVSIAVINGTSVISPAGVVYARMLASALGGRGLSEWLGRDAGFERHPRAQNEGIRHCHVRLMGKDEPWNHSTRQFARVSDNFLVYARHWQYDNYYQILALLSPDAHTSINSLLPAFCAHTERSFSCLSEYELRQLANISG
ncbi:type II toxin-antitoxin system YafO family toxin [Hafnia alvei]|uniref:type II toxin-antitoxin system YafO family toxin n=1 Tax=Hafnia alvei TaxID=569 RepID=UPI000B62D21B|nr:type II toxin-antitoxin system YafO family toxin [Hafnia alvei]MBI0277283.1 type II toxin-antitoxin system YafO family toxin [Hafnia alvei]PNK96237.1 hypothetical protein CEQ28_000810 [Hafnia alvei]PNK97570.1 hypothetical protein CEQ28_008190 [Hafnia alvei]